MTERTMTRLRPVYEEWSSALAVVAHPDDLEFGMSAAIARWTAQGKKIAYCLATSGEAGIDGIPPEEAGPLREREERAAALAVGVEWVEFLGYPDGVLEYSIPLRRDLSRAIRRHRPEVVITGNHREFFERGGLNQADHVALGRAVIDATRDAGNRWVFRELADEGAQPWDGVRTVLVAGSPMAAHGIDITGHLAAGQASLLAHATYLAGIGGPMADPARFLERVASAAGERLNCEHAVACEVITLRLGPSPGYGWPCSATGGGILSPRSTGSGPDDDLTGPSGPRPVSQAARSVSAPVTGTRSPEPSVQLLPLGTVNTSSVPSGTLGSRYSKRCKHSSADHCAGLTPRSRSTEWISVSRQQPLSTSVRIPGPR